MTDLAALLVVAIDHDRDRINASPIAHGETGRIEIHVNPSMCSVHVVVLVESPPRAA